MKILLLVDHFDDASPTGMISKRIAGELYGLGNEVAVVSSDQVGNKWGHGYHSICKRIHLFPGKLELYSRRVLELLSNLTCTNLDTALWRYRMSIAAGRLIRVFHPDVVYARSNPISVCEVAAKIKRKHGLKVVMHFTDPVPAPLEWDKDLRYRKRLSRVMDRILPWADRISFGNRAMMEYQQRNLSYPFLDKAFVSPDPVSHETLYYRPEAPGAGETVLTYLGSIYGNRNPEQLFKAMERLNSEGRNVVLNIYDFNRTGASVPPFVRFVGRVKDVDGVLLDSRILINLDGDDKEPVFIASKLKEYLCCGRPILSITPEGSPSRLLTDSLKTVISVRNGSDEIYDALKRFLELQFTESDYAERDGLIKQFTPKTVGGNLYQELKGVLS
jgi:glycosyltransferase involved in cell wall biosynthesis